jgi:hypothetical protein
MCETFSIKNSIIRNFANNGIMILSSSNCQIISTCLDKCVFGITIKEDSNMRMENSIVSNMKKSSIKCFGNSSVIAQKTLFSCSTQSHFLSYLGGMIDIKDSSVIHTSTSSPLLLLSMNGSSFLHDLSITSVHENICNFKGSKSFRQLSVKMNKRRTSNVDIQNEGISRISNGKCFLCGNDANGHYLFPCLHKAYCPSCLVKIKLPACDQTATKLMEPQPLEVDEICPVCLTETANMMVFPCCHRFCSGCVDSWKKNGANECMTCDGKSTSIIPLPKDE